MMLAEVGIAGQRAIARRVAHVAGPSGAHDVAELYARRAGFSSIVDGEIGLDPGDVPALVTTPAARMVLAGARAALAEIRRALFDTETKNEPA